MLFCVICSYVDEFGAASTPSTLSGSSRFSPAVHHQAKRRKRADPVDQMLAESIRAMQQKQAARATREIERLPSGSAYHFGMELALQLDKLTDRQMALAKIRIHQVMLDIEYPPQEHYSPGYSASMPYPSNYYGNQ